MILREAFDCPFSRLDPAEAPHIDPPSVAIYETLVLKDRIGRPQPMLAQTWATSADGLSWRFQLREGLRFHSGEVCDANAVAAALQTLRAGDSTGGELWYWMPVDEVRVESSRSLLFTLRHPYVRMTSLLWGTHTAIHGEAARRANRDSYGFSFADGTGQFRLVDWSVERVVVERWRGYPGAAAPASVDRRQAGLEGIEWIALPDDEKRLDALLSGEVHCLHGPPLESVEDLRRLKHIRLFEFPQSSNVYLALHWHDEVIGFRDLPLRRAISAAIDRVALVRDGLSGQGAATWGPLGPGDPYYDPGVDVGRGFDAGAADALLDELGWRLKSDGVRARNGCRLNFDCLVQDDQVMRRLAGAVQEQLRRRGIELTLRFAAPFADFYAACERQPQSFIGKWLWQDGIDALIGFTATWGQPAPNWQHSSIPELDRAYHAWLRAGTEEQLRGAASRIQAVVANELPYLPLVTPTDLWACSARLHGWEPYPANLYPFYKDVWLELEA